jgi:hypothetical protein
LTTSLLRGVVEVVQTPALTTAVAVARVGSAQVRDLASPLVRNTPLRLAQVARVEMELPPHLMAAIPRLALLLVRAAVVVEMDQPLAQQAVLVAVAAHCQANRAGRATLQA